MTQSSQTEHVDLPEQTEAAIEEAERLLRVARGENVDERLSRTPWDFNLPTGEDLRAMRERCGLSMQEAADMMDYEYQTVNSYETGNGTPGREFLRRALILYKREWPRHDWPRRTHDAHLSELPPADGTADNESALLLEKLHERTLASASGNGGDVLMTHTYQPIKDVWTPADVSSLYIQGRQHGQTSWCNAAQEVARVLHDR